MFFSQRLIIIVILVCLQLMDIHSYCNICIRCNSCSNDVTSDNNLDIIDSLLKQKFKDLQYPTIITKVTLNQTNIKYLMGYNNNITLNLSLDTQTGKISILSYINNNQATFSKIRSQCLVNCSNTTNSINNNLQNITNQIAQTSNISKVSNSLNQNTILNNSSALIQTTSIQTSMLKSQSLNVSNLTNTSGSLFYRISGFNFLSLQAYNFTCQTQQLISKFLCRKYYGDVAQNNIKLINFKSYGLFSRLVYFINYGSQIKAFQIVVSTDNNNSTISVISFTEITSLIHIQANSIYYGAQDIMDFSNTLNTSTSLLNQNVTNNQNSANSSIVLSSNIKFYVEISDLNSPQVTSLQGYLSSIFYKTYSKLTLVKIESQFVLKQNSPYKQFTSYRLTYKVKKYELTTTQPLFYQLVITKTVTTISTIYDVISAIYMNLLPLTQISNVLLNRSLSSTDVKNDQNLPFIDSIIIKQFQQQLGTSPSIIKILRHEPFYLLTYKDLQNKQVKFMILYDVLLNSIQFYKNDNTTAMQNQTINQNSSTTLNISTNIITNKSNSTISPTKNATAGSMFQQKNSNSSTQNNQNSISNNISSSLLYLSPFLNYSSGTINIPANVSSALNYSKFVQVTNFLTDPNVIKVVNYLLGVYGTEINNFMRIKDVYHCENYYQLIFEIRRFQSINATLFYQMVIFLQGSQIKVVSTQYINNYVHSLNPKFLTQNICFDSSNLSTDLYFPIINQYVLSSNLNIQNLNISLNNLLQGAVLKSVGRYLPFYIFSYTNGVGIITFYDILSKKTQILFVNKINEVSNNFGNDYNSPMNNNKSNIERKNQTVTNLTSNPTSYQVVNNSNSQIQSINVKIASQIKESISKKSNTSLQNLTQSYATINNSLNALSLQKTPTLSIKEIELLSNNSSKANISVTSNNANLINRNESNLANISNNSNIVIKQVGISIGKFIVSDSIVHQISAIFWSKVDQFLNPLNITKFIPISKNLIDYNRLKTIDYTQPLMLTFKSSTSNPYFSNNQTDYSMLSKLMTFYLLKQNMITNANINSINMQLILESTFKTYKRFVLMQSSAQIVYQVIVNNQFVLLSFRQLASFYQLTSDPFSNYFNISLDFDSQIQKFQTLKVYTDIISKAIPVQIVNFKQIQLKLLANSYKYTFSYFTNQVNSSKLLWLVTELIVSVEKQTIQVISHKIISPIQKMQLNIASTNLIKNQNSILPSFLSDQNKKDISSIINVLIKAQAQLIFANQQWITVLLELYTIKNDFSIVIFVIKYKNKESMIQFTFKGKFNILNKYIVLTQVAKNNNGFSIITSYDKSQLNNSPNISSILNKGKQVFSQLIDGNASKDNLPQFIYKKTLLSGQNIYVLVYGRPILCQISISDSQFQLISISYVNDIQTGQYFDEVALLEFHQIRLPQIKFYSLYNNLMANASTQFSQLNKSTILALYTKQSFDILTYLSIYQYNSQLMAFQITINKTNNEINSGYNKNINITASGYYLKNCKTQNNQGLCISCSNSNLASFQLWSGRCYQTIINCKNQLAYKCYSCLEPYWLINNTCTSIDTVNLSSINYTNYSGQSSNCVAFDSNSDTCIKCQLRFYLNNSGICQMIQPQCKTYDQVIGKCLTCQDGFNLNANTQSCQKTSKICKSFNTNGQCCQCPGFQNYILFDGICYPINLNLSRTTFLSQNISKVIKTNLFCQKWLNNKCYSCFSGTIININGVCQISNVNCLSFDYNYQKCNVCARQCININGRCVNNNN